MVTCSQHPMYRIFKSKHRMQNNTAHRPAIGIVNMYTNPHGSLYIAQAVFALGYTPLLLQYSDTLCDSIKNSNIRYWIFSGGNQTVSHKGTPRACVKQLLQMPHKSFFLICYSMESALYEMGYPLIKRRTGTRREYTPLLLNGRVVRVWRNHRYYIPSTSIVSRRQVKEIASLHDESMMCIYKNLTMTQFHPERTPDGHSMLEQWIKTN